MRGPGGLVARCRGCGELRFTPREKGVYRISWPGGSLEHEVRGRGARIYIFHFPRVVEEGGELSVVAFVASDRGVEEANITVMVSSDGREWRAVDCGSPCVAKFHVDYLIFNKLFLRAIADGPTIEEVVEERAIPARGGYAVLTAEELVQILTATTVIFAATTVAFAALWLRERA